MRDARVKKKEDVLGLVQPASIPQLALNAREALCRVWEFLNPVCAVDVMDSYDIPEEHELCYRDVLVKNILLDLTDLPYNMHQFRQDDSSGYDGLTTYYLVDVFKFGKAVMKPGSVGHKLCSAL